MACRDRVAEMSVDGAAREAVFELGPNIRQNLLEDEKRKAPNVRLIGSQPQVSWEMRPQLLEFLAQAHQALELRAESLALSVSMLDRYMSRRVVYARHYQLLGCVCLWLAAKLVDDKTNVPTAQTLAYLCAGIYEESLFRDMEFHVLKSLEWEIMAPVAIDFVEHSTAEVARWLGSLFSMRDRALCQSMTRYICEASLFHGEISEFRPSVVSASATALSLVVLDVIGGYNWPPVFPDGCAKECFDALVAVIASPPPAIEEKFRAPSELSAAAVFKQFFAAMHAELAETPLTPVTPASVASRSASLASVTSLSSMGPHTPSDDELQSPRGVKNSPRTVFVPLTPEEWTAPYCNVEFPGKRHVLPP